MVVIEGLFYPSPKPYVVGIILIFRIEGSAPVS